MRKLGVIVFLAALSLSGCAAPQAEASTINPEIRKELCEHFAAGFTVEDSVSVQRELFGDEAADKWQKTVEAVEASGC